jgi:predicted transcriptional regulator
MTDAIGFVLGSSARREVLARLADGDGTGREVVGACDASESAVYDALARLAERDYVAETDDGTWELTGAGRIVADAMERCERLDDVLGGQAEYWATHDPTGLPERFRRSIDRLECCEVIRSPDTDPYRAARRVSRAIRAASDVGIVTPVYSERHATALLESDAERRRLVMTPRVVDRLLTDQPAGPDAEFDTLQIRVQPAAVSVTVTDRRLHCSLPESDGSFDATSELHAESDAAIAWGRDLFEHYWERGTPIGQWVACEHPEAVADESIRTPPATEGGADPAAFCAAEATDARHSTDDVSDGTPAPGEE